MQVLFVWFRYFCLNWLGSRLVLIGLGCRCRLVVIFFLFFFYIFLVLNDCCLSVFCYPSGFLLFASVFFCLLMYFGEKSMGRWLCWSMFLVLFCIVFGWYYFGWFLVDIVYGWHGLWLILFLVDIVFVSFLHCFCNVFALFICIVLVCGCLCFEHSECFLIVFWRGGGTN